MNTSLLSADAQAVLADYRPRIEDKINNDTFTLPMLPQVASEVMALTKNMNADLEDLSNLIHKDQVLAGHVLRISNSAAFGTTDKIVSLSQAVSRLGMAILGEIALSASLKNGIFAAPGYEDLIKKLWNYSLAAGAFGKEIARSRRYNVEGQFLSSLLHGIGKPVVLQLILEVNKETDQKIPLDAAEVLVDEFHIILGKKVAEKWKLPQSVQTCIEFYKKPLETKNFKYEAMMTCLSGALSDWVLNPDTISEEAIRKHSIFTELNFYPDDMQAILDKKESVIETLNAMSV